MYWLLVDLRMWQLWHHNTRKPIKGKLNHTVCGVVLSQRFKLSLHLNQWRCISFATIYLSKLWPLYTVNVSVKYYNVQYIVYKNQISCTCSLINTEGQTQYTLDQYRGPNTVHAREIGLYYIYACVICTSKVHVSSNWRLWELFKNSHVTWKFEKI